MRLMLWNIQWTRAATPRGKRIHELISEFNPDILCLTETTLGMLPPDGHSILSTEDYGYPHHGNRRKVVLWSKQEWTEVDDLGSGDLPGGRYVSGVSGGIRFTGVCIPWKEAHVKAGRKDRALWEDHTRYLTAVNPLILSQLKTKYPLCFLGDFNQRIPKGKQPESVYKDLLNLLRTDLTCITASTNGGLAPLIDHVTISRGLSAHVMTIIPRVCESGLRLSDHDGIVCDIREI